MHRVLNSGVVPPPPEHPIVPSVFDRIPDQPKYFAARLPLTVPRHPTTFALAYALISLTGATPTYQPSLSGTANLVNVSIDHQSDHNTPCKTSFNRCKNG